MKTENTAARTAQTENTGTLCVTVLRMIMYKVMHKIHQKCIVIKSLIVYNVKKEYPR
jgi:hypothetical protein